jgi:hypothetical protein
VAEQQLFNFVTFTPEGVSLSERVFLTLEGDFVLQTGVEPNVNRAIVPQAEYLKLAGNVGKPGKIEFFYSSNPLPEPLGQGAGATPDHTHGGVRIVEITPGRFGRVSGAAADTVIWWTLYFGDVRERFGPPYGGRVVEGLLNPDANEDGVVDANPLTNSALMQICLSRMGATNGGVPADVDATPAPKNLRWFGEPAVVELAKLLDHCGCVLVPNKDGSVKVERIGTGALPTPPSFRKEFDQTVPTANRRGLVVIFTSAPNAAVTTEKIKGPSASTWEYVIQDRNGVWRSIDDTAVKQDYWFGSTPEEVIKKGYAPVPPQYQDRVEAQLFRCVRLSPTAYDARLQKVLRYQLLPKAGETGLTTKFIAMRAKRAQYDRAAQLYRKGTELVDTFATTLIGSDGGSVICSSHLLGNIDGTTPGTFLERFARLAADDLEIACSVETVVAAPDDPQRKVPEYYNDGYRRNPDNTIVQLSELEARTLLSKPDADVVIISQPELRLVRDKTGATATDNRAALDAAGATLASQYFAGAGQIRTIAVKGYLPVDLSGQVTEVRWSQRELRTTITVDATVGALGPRLTPDRLRQASGGGDGATKGSSKADPLPLGTVAGGAQPAVPLGTPPPAPEQRRTEWTMNITTATRINNYFRWSYAVVEQEKSTAGTLGAWRDKPNGKTGTAFNLKETNNDTAGLMGNGVTLNSQGFIAGTKLTLKPVIQRVRCWEETNPDGTKEFWFSEPNLTDGPCT